jgi:hypothetical protein
VGSFVMLGALAFGPSPNHPVALVPLGMTAVQVLGVAGGQRVAGAMATVATTGVTGVAVLLVMSWAVGWLITHMLDEFGLFDLI